MTASHQLIHSSVTNEWYTPAVYIEAAREVMGSIDLDPASCAKANLTVKAFRYYDDEIDGLSRDWTVPAFPTTTGVFLNPPYGKTNGKSNQDLWSQHLRYQYALGYVDQAVLLVNAVPGEKWFKHLFDFPICFTDHRIRFINQHGVACKSPTHSNAFVYIGDEVEKFKMIFEQFGTVTRRI